MILGAGVLGSVAGQLGGVAPVASAETRVTLGGVLRAVRAGTAGLKQIEGGD